MVINCFCFGNTPSIYPKNILALSLDFHIGIVSLTFSSGSMSSVAHSGKRKYILGTLKANHHLHNWVLMLAFHTLDCGKWLGLSSFSPVCPFLLLHVPPSLFPVYTRIILGFWSLSILWLRSHLSGLSTSVDPWRSSFSFPRTAANIDLFLGSRFTWFRTEFHITLPFPLFSLLPSPRLVTYFWKVVSFWNMLDLCRSSIAWCLAGFRSLILRILKAKMTF